MTKTPPQVERSRKIIHQLEQEGGQEEEEEKKDAKEKIANFY